MENSELEIFKARADGMLVGSIPSAALLLGQFISEEIQLPLIMNVTLVGYVLLAISFKLYVSVKMRLQSD